MQAHISHNQHSFDNTTVTARKKSRLFREAWFSGNDALNRHIDLHPAYRALMNRKTQKDVRNILQSRNSSHTKYRHSRTGGGHTMACWPDPVRKSTHSLPRTHEPKDQKDVRNILQSRNSSHTKYQHSRTGGGHTMACWPDPVRKSTPSLPRTHEPKYQKDVRNILQSRNSSHTKYQHSRTGGGHTMACWPDPVRKSFLSAPHRSLKKCIQSINQ